MFKPNIKSIDKRDGRIRFIVEFFDDVNKVEDEIILTSTQNLKGILTDRCNQLDKLYSSLVPTGLFDITPDPVIPLTQIELDKKTFFGDWDKWLRIKMLIDAGVLVGNELRVVALKDKVKAGFKPEYFEL